MTTNAQITRADSYHWAVQGSLDSLAAEAAVAGHYRVNDEDVWWYGGNNPGIDVVAGADRVDVKVAFRHTVWTEFGECLCLGFMGSLRRTPEVREDVTHYWLVEVDPSGEFHTTGDRVTLDAAFEVKAYKFTRDEINTRFKPAWTRRDNAVGAGANLYLPLEEARLAQQPLARRGQENASAVAGRPVATDS